MSQPLELPLPANFDLDDTYQVRVTAISATTGSVVAGVNVGEVTLVVDNLAGTPESELTFGSFSPILIRRTVTV